MNKGFAFWSSAKAISFFIKAYWLIYFFFYFVAVWTSVSMRNPLAFLLIGVLPYLVLRTYKAIHDPLYDLKESIEKISPTIFQSILQQRSKLNIALVSQKQQNGFLYAGLLLLNKDSVDQRIDFFIKNNKRINRSGMVSLSLWFFTFLILVFILFINR